MFMAIFFTRRAATWLVTATRVLVGKILAAKFVHSNLPIIYLMLAKLLKTTGC